MENLLTVLAWPQKWAARRAIDKGCFVSLHMSKYHVQAGPHGMTLPSLNGLRAFEAAARHLSFTRAAAELNVTQTAISHQIRRLEEQLGTPPVRAAQSRPGADARGAGYLPAVRAAFEDLRQATARLQRPGARRTC